MPLTTRSTLKGKASAVALATAVAAVALAAAATPAHATLDDGQVRLRAPHMLE